jgi:exosome complex component RRP40
LLTCPEKNIKYVPSPNDLVIGQVMRSAGEAYQVSLGAYTAPATLPHLAFEGASKKTRPQLASGAVVYARVALANRHMDPELECVSAGTGKAEGLGPLVGGCVFDVSAGFARRLLRAGGGAGKNGAGLVFLEALATDGGLAFETAVGRNGKVWVGSESVRTVVLVGRALREVDEKGLDERQQRKLAGKLLSER